MTAAVAAEAVRPARPEQVFTTLFVGPEPGVELKEILREIVGQHASLRWVVRSHFNYGMTSRQLLPAAHGELGIKKLSELVRERREEYPERGVEVWAFDEHRLGLKPVLRRQWAPRGQRPVAVGRHRYEWLYLYGFLYRPPGRWSGSSAARSTPACSARCWRRSPRRSGPARAARGPGPRQRGLARQRRLGGAAGDRAGLPAALHAELQPAEHLWPLADEAVANKHFATLKDLDAALGERCRTLADMPEAIKAATSFGWWPAAVPANAVPN